MSHIPVSAEIIYDGVVIGVLSMHLVQLSIIFLACLISVFVATLVNAPCLLVFASIRPADMIDYYELTGNNLI